MEKERTYIAIDLKSFYASVECVERGLDPLKARLVVADKSKTEKTICLAVSPSLKALGIKGRARLFEVEERIREIQRTTGRRIEYIAAKPRMALYIKYSSRIYSIYLRYVSPDDIHIYSIDECFIDATDYLKLYNLGAEEFARKLIEGVLDETGITATAGIGSNMYLAKVAMDIIAKHVQADAKGVRIAALNLMSYREKLWDHKPLTDFWRLGPGIEDRLAKYRIFTMGDLARFSLHSDSILFREFGVDAEILIDHAWGEEPTLMKDIKAYRPKDSSLSNGQVLSCPYDYEHARLIVHEMAEELSFMLLERRAEAATISLYLFYDKENVDKGIALNDIGQDYYGRRAPKSVHGAEHLPHHSAIESQIADAALRIFDGITNKLYTIRKIYITASDLIEEGSELYLDLLGENEREEKEKKLQRAMLDIKSTFGKNSIVKATAFEEGSTALERNRQIGGHRA